MSSNWSYNPETLNSGQNWWFFFVLCDLEIWQMSLKNNRASLLCYVKLCASFHSHRSIQTGVTIWKRQIWVKIVDFFVPCDLGKFDRWPWKTLGHLFYAISSFVHHFIAIGQFKLELQSWNAKFGSKSDFLFVPCDLEIWRMTLKNNRAPFLCHKLCASFHWDGKTIHRAAWLQLKRKLALREFSQDFNQELLNPLQNGFMWH